MMKKNNKGFIATSLLYSFFLVFLAMLLAILQNYSSSSNILSRFNDEVKNHINERKNRLTDIIINKANNEKNFAYKDGNTKETFVFPMGEGDNTYKEYRYIGENPNNYIKLGDEDWRIIGVFKTKQKINENELSTYSVKIISSISDTKYKYNEIELGNIDNSNIANAAFYSVEIDNINQSGEKYYKLEKAGNEEYKTKSIPYVSDYLYTYAYGFDSPENHSGTCFSEGNCPAKICTEYKEENDETTCETYSDNKSWMYTENSEWFLSKSGIAVKYESDTNNKIIKEENSNTKYKYRETLYLKYDVSIVDGNGTKDEPYILSYE